MNRYGISQVVTSKKPVNWFLIIVILLGFVAVASLGDGHTEYGYTVEGGRL